MKKQQKEPWQIAAARFFVERSEESFTKEEYKKYILSKYHVADHHLEQFFREEVEIPPGRDCTTAIREGSRGWVPPLSLVSTVVDYDELQDARKNARNAFLLSMIAIIISVATLVVAIKK